MGACKHCGQNAGFLRKQHGQCRDLHATGIREMTHLAAQSAGSPGFSEVALRQTLRVIAGRAHATEEDISQAIAAGWAQGVRHAMSDGIITRDEETQLRHFRDRLVSGDDRLVSEAVSTLDQAASDRLMTDARMTAIATQDGEARLQDLDGALRQAGFPQDSRHQLLVRAWEAAVERAIEDGVIAPGRGELPGPVPGPLRDPGPRGERQRAHTSLIQAAVIRDVTQVIVPQRQNIQGQVPFNLMKSEQLVWVIQGVDYLETVVRRERRGSSQGLSIRVARGLYYRPSTFRSRPMEWEETVHAGTGMLGLTTKHIYFAGSRKRFRVWYDRIISLECQERQRHPQITARPGAPAVARPRLHTNGTPRRSD